MSTLTTINSNDVIANSRSDINNNFSALNTDKIETSTLDTDTSLTANSDSKIATQKAVKAYVDAGGNVNASTTQKGIVEEATAAEITAGTGTGATGARLFVNPTSIAETGTDKIIKTKSTGLLDSTIVPALPISSGVTTRTGTTASGTQTIAHGLSVTPSFARFNVTCIDTATGNSLSFSRGTSNGSSHSCSGAVTNEGGGAAVSDIAYSSGSVCIAVTDVSGTPASNNAQTATASFDSTNITLTWTKVGSGLNGTIQIHWEAQK